MSQTYATLVENLFGDLYAGWRQHIQFSSERLVAYVQNHLHEFPPTCLKLRHHDISIEIPIDVSDQGVVTAAVIGVSTVGFSECLSQLIPHWTTPDSEALLEAADAGHLECVNMLLAVCDPLYRNSQALCSACINDEPNIFDLLLPVSDPQAALTHLRTPLMQQYYTTLSNSECFQRLEAVVQRHTIGAHVGGGNTVVRKI